MNILVIGSGGREHAFAWKIQQSTQCGQLYVAPGNAGTAQIAENVAIAVDDFEALGKFALDQDIKLIVVGPEVPLVKGIRDFFESDSLYKNISIVGPGKAGALLEGSKDFSKSFMERNGVPTAQSKTFDSTQITEGLAYLDTIPTPIVLKADGLAAGKGVIICESREEAKESLTEMLVDKKFGDASAKVLIEQFLKGIELSVFVLTDGENYVLLPEAKDYKRIGEGDTGPNTGGMGAVSPVHFADDAFMEKVTQKVIEPTIAGLKKEGIEYQGFIFIGLMNVAGEPYVIEYNVRMGDPETQAVIPRIQNDLIDLLYAAATKNLGDKTIDIDHQATSTVVMVAEGYPGSYEKGKVIAGIENVDNATVFHAGTKADSDKILTNGGRVLAVTGKGDDIDTALHNAYIEVKKIQWEGANFRNDIGKDLIALQTN